LALELVNELGSLGLGERLCDFAAGVPGQRGQVRRLSTSHRLVAGDPFVRVLVGIVSRARGSRKRFVGGMVAHG
jgi:hypothetical protein